MKNVRNTIKKIASSICGKSIIEVIPSYLSKIESTLTKKEEFPTPGSIENMLESIIKNFSQHLQYLYFEDVNFLVINDCPEGYEETIAFVKVNNIDINESKSKKTEFKVNFDKTITFCKNYFNSFAIDVYKTLEIDNPKLLELIRIVILENALAHELRHIIQLKTYNFQSGDIDIVTPQNCASYDIHLEDNSFALLISEETRQLFENDSVEFTHHLAELGITIIDDLKLKRLITNMEISNIFNESDKLISNFEKLEKYVKKNY